MYYTASGITTPVDGRPLHRLREDCEVVSLVSRDFKLDRHFETELLPGSKEEAAVVTNSNRLRLFSKTTAACTETH